MFKSITLTGPEGEIVLRREKNFPNFILEKTTAGLVYCLKAPNNQLFAGILANRILAQNNFIILREELL